MQVMEYVLAEGSSGGENGRPSRKGRRLMTGQSRGGRYQAGV